MSMKQKVSDFILLIKSEKKYKFFAGLAVLAILFLAFSGPGTKKKRAKKKKRPPATKTGSFGSKEAYEDLLTAFRTDLERQEANAELMSKRVEGLEKNIENYHERTAEIFKKILERIAESEARGEYGVETASSYGDADPTAFGADGGMAPSEELEAFGDFAVPEVAPPPPPPPGRVAFVGAGDSVRVKLLAGVRAPTDGTPYPVVLKLIGDVQGPDGSTLPLGEARLIAAAQGSLSDQRALFRLTSLSIRHPNGRRKVIDVDGWIVGEDGMRGMQGILLDPVGKLILGAGVVAGINAAGEGIAASQTRTRENATGGIDTIITGDVSEYAMGKSIGGIGKEYGNIIRDRVKKLVPHVEIYSGRVATAVFAKSFAIRELFDELEAEDLHYASLD